MKKVHFNFVGIVLAAGFISFPKCFFQVMDDDWMKLENVPLRFALTVDSLLCIPPRIE